MLLFCMLGYNASDSDTDEEKMNMKSWFERLEF